MKMVIIYSKHILLGRMTQSIMVLRSNMINIILNSLENIKPLKSRISFKFFISLFFNSFVEKAKLESI